MSEPFSIDNSSTKANALSAMAETLGKLKEPEKTFSLLAKAISSADNINKSSNKTKALMAISESAANLKKWRLALKAYQECPSDDCEVSTLASILTIYAEQQNPDLKEEESKEWSMNNEEYRINESNIIVGF